jgi:SAM-dependent methyltransferase
VDKIALIDLVRRDMNPEPWAEGEKIPWHDPDFSRRMLKEHLSQKHDAASRRTPTIKKHVDWIHKHVLDGKPSCILDLGCGPGFYTSRLAALGHACHGIDFSPASIEYANKYASESCTHTLGDIRTTDFGSGYDLIIFIFGEFNVFKPEDAVLILKKAFIALKPGGQLLLEVISFDAVYESGNQPATWYSAEKDLFADEPHMCLLEAYWDDERSVAMERYYIVDSVSGEVTRYAVSTQAYAEDRFKEMLQDIGFDEISMYPSLSGKPNPAQSEMFVIIAQKGEKST